VLRLFCIVGLSMIEPTDAVEVGKDCYHLQYSPQVKLRQKVSVVELVLSMVRIAVRTGYRARIGVLPDVSPVTPVAMSGIRSWFARGKLMDPSLPKELTCVTGVEQCELLSGVTGDDLLGAEAGGSSHEHVSKVKETPVVVKQLCSVCGFLVNPLRHNERCKVQGVKKLDSGWSNQRKKAWVRDTVLRYDVQVRIAASKIPTVEWNRVMEEYTSGEAQVRYWNSLEDKTDLPVPSGTSVHSISTAFECSYEGSFRIAYLQFVETGISVRSREF